MKGNNYRKGIVLLSIVAIGLIGFFGFLLEQKKLVKDKIVLNNLEKDEKQDMLDSKENENEGSNLKNDSDKINSASEYSLGEKNSEEKVKDEVLVIDINGAVNKPGIYKLKPNSRINDAIEIAGGLSDLANEEIIAKQINKAEKLYDGQKIYIPKKDDPTYILNEIQESQDEYVGQAGNGKRKINLKTATKEQLMTLNGIGESYADRILEYRKNNGFNKIEDLMNVKGIGEKRFEDLKEYLVVE